MCVAEEIVIAGKVIDAATYAPGRNQKMLLNNIEKKMLPACDLDKVYSSDLLATKEPWYMAVGRL